jgi:uncharacterized protein YjbI with pentapeptide repeats
MSSKIANIPRKEITEFKDGYYTKSPVYHKDKLRGIQWDEVNISHSNFNCVDMENASLNNSMLHHSSFLSTRLVNASIRISFIWGSSLIGADLTNADLTGSELLFANLTGANLTNAKLNNADLKYTNLKAANFEGADLTNADLTGAKMDGINLARAIGIGTKTNEIKEAQRILHILDAGLGSLDMKKWHSNLTTRSIAGWIVPDQRQPAQKASLICPTLSQYFCEPKEEVVMEKLRLVASGKLSVLSD